MAELRTGDLSNRGLGILLMMVTAFVAIIMKKIVENEVSYTVLLFLILALAIWKAPKYIKVVATILLIPTFLMFWYALAGETGVAKVAPFISHFVLEYGYEFKETLFEKVHAPLRIYMILLYIIWLLHVLISFIAKSIKSFYRNSLAKEKII